MSDEPFDLKRARARVYALVRACPPGRVTTYGWIASAIGLPGHARLVGWIMNGTPAEARVPAQRVVNSQGVLTGAHLAGQASYDLPALLPQILSGHRLWAQASGKVERFIAVHDLQFWHDSAAHTLWLRIYLQADDLSRLNVSHARLLAESGLGATFREVQSDVAGQICFEQTATQPCPNNYPADHIHHVVEAVRPNLWTTVSSIPPYRRYYLYLCPPTDLPHRLPQLLSMYAVTFYLGSITRYRPHHFDALLRGAFGPRVRDFVTGQPLQFLYLMASEMARRDVAKPSIL